MDIALMVLGLFVLAIVLSWAYSYLDDPKEIDQEEEREVRQESPEVHERAAFERAAKEAKSNAQDIELYSPGDAADQE